MHWMITFIILTALEAIRQMDAEERRELTRVLFA